MASAKAEARLRERVASLTDELAEEQELAKQEIAERRMAAAKLQQRVEMLEKKNTDRSMRIIRPMWLYGYILERQFRHLQTALHKRTVKHADERRKFESFSREFKDLKGKLASREVDAEVHVQQLQKQLKDLEELGKQVEAQYQAKIVGYQQLYHEQQLSWWEKQISDQKQVNEARVEAALQMPSAAKLTTVARANVERAHQLEIEQAEQALRKQAAKEAALQQQKKDLLEIIRVETIKAKETAMHNTSGQATERRDTANLQQRVAQLRKDVRGLWGQLGWDDEQMLMQVEGKLALMRASVNANQALEAQLAQLRSEVHINKLSAECVAREDELHDLQRTRGTQQHTLANAMEALAEVRTQARGATAAHRELYGEAPPVAIC